MQQKLLNFLLVFFIVLLGLNMFLPSPTKNQTPVSGVFLKLGSQEYVSPNIPDLTVHNASSGAIAFNTCKDFKILKDYREISNLPAAFCRDIRIDAGSQTGISLVSVAPLFSAPGNFGYRLVVGKEEATASSVQSEPGSFRTFFFQAFYAPVYNLFVFLVALVPGHAFGWAVIMVTLVIRFLLLIPQHHVLVNSRKMQAIQPKIKALQEKLKGDQAKLGIELLELYKKEKVNPLGSCLPLMIQMPILIVLYWVIQDINNPASTYYLYEFQKDFNVSVIQTVFYGIDLLHVGGIVGAILAVVVGALQWVQIKFSLPKVEEKAPKKFEKKEDGSLEPEISAMPDPAMMNAMMLWMMPLMMAFTTYYLPAGVGIYWFVGTVFMIIQQLVVNTLHPNDKKAAE